MSRAPGPALRAGQLQCHPRADGRDDGLRPRVGAHVRTRHAQRLAQARGAAVARSEWAADSRACLHPRPLRRRCGGSRAVDRLARRCARSLSPLLGGFAVAPEDTRTGRVGPAGRTAPADRCRSRPGRRAQEDRVTRVAGLLEAQGLLVLGGITPPLRELMPRNASRLAGYDQRHRQLSASARHGGVPIARSGSWPREPPAYTVSSIRFPSGSSTTLS